jgi:hypothetical protein
MKLTSISDHCILKQKCEKTMENLRPPNVGKKHGREFCEQLPLKILPLPR